MKYSNEPKRRRPQAERKPDEGATKVFGKSQTKVFDKKSTKVFDKKASEKDPMKQSADLYRNSEPKVNKESGKWRFAPAVVFVAFIFTFAVWFIFNPKLDYSSSEKRYLQKFPSASFENISSGKFGSEFESYFADHFPQRDLWVGLNAYYILGTGNNGASGVYNCTDGYLINKPVSIDNNLDKNIGVISKFRENISAPMTVMLVPSTGYICSDKLPMVHNSYRDDEYMNRTKNTLFANNINFVDLRESFKSAYKAGTQLYYRTDHHWTTEGAYLGYTNLCEQLGQTPAPRESFNIETYPGFYGTTYSTSGFRLTEPDSISVWNDPDNSAANIRVKISEGTESNEYDSMFFYDHLDEDDKYPVFIDGNHALTEITNSKAKGGTIVLIKDSFSHCLAPFLAENYKKVILVDTRYYKQSISEIVNRERPEQVVVLYGIDNLATDTDIVWLK